MIEHQGNQSIIRYTDGSWQAVHDKDLYGGPNEIQVAGETLAVIKPFYIDDMSEDTAVLKRFRAFRKTGAAVVASEGYFPIGGEVKFFQNYKYASNHVRVTFDLRWPKGMMLKRRFGFGEILLPGRWKKYFCIPPASHVAEGKDPQWVDFSEYEGKSVMSGHWHRPPLSLVFEREDGMRFELSCGSDIWRWEQCMGFGPENGSYKIFVEEQGIRIVREPLMCCSEFEPQARDYRFSWVMAWTMPGEKKALDEKNASLLSMSGEQKLHKDKIVKDGSTPMMLDAESCNLPDFADCTPSPTDNVLDKRSDTVCWEGSAAQKRVRKVIRSLKGECEPGTLIFRNFLPGICWDARHLNRKNKEGLCHWNLDSLLDFSEWTRKQLGDDWKLSAVVPAPWDELPSMQNCFDINGFENEEYFEFVPPEERE